MTIYSRLVRFFVALFLPGLVAGCAYLELASIGPNGEISVWDSHQVSVSGNGRFTVFSSFDELGFPDNGVGLRYWDVFVRDQELGVTERISVSTTGGMPFNNSTLPAISDDGRVVVFRSTAPNIVPGDTNFASDVFAYDRQTQQMERINVDSSENQTSGDGSTGPAGRHISVSQDGRYVAFVTRANHLVPGDTDGLYDVFVRDRVAGTTEIVSVDNSENNASSIAFEPSITDDGRYVAFSTPVAWGALDNNGTYDVYVRDRVAGTTTRVSINNIFSLLSNGSSRRPAISGDGGYIAFESASTDLVAGDTNGVNDVFVFNRGTGFTRRVSTIGYSTLQADGASDFASISDDGRFVAFRSEATDLVTGDTNGVADMFVKDTGTLRTFRVSADRLGEQILLPVEVTPESAISNDGRYVAFAVEDQLDAKDTNDDMDAYHRFALEPGPVSGGGMVAAGTSAGVPVSSSGWLDPSNVGATIIPGDDITVDSVTWTGSPGSESAVIQITVAPGAVSGPRDIFLWNPGQWNVGAGASVTCENCLVIN